MPRTGTAVATVSPMEQFKKEIELRRTHFGNALPAHVPVEKFQANLMAAAAMTPKLLECSRGSLFTAAMTAAQLGLLVDPVLGHAYLVPFGNQVTCIPGYRGFIHLARQSGEIASLYAHEVYENDEFDVQLGTAKRIHHKPLLKGERGQMIGVYAAWSYSKAIDQRGNLATDFEYMTVEDIEAIRTRSKAGNSGPWKTDYVQMARKTVIRRAAKYLPISVQRAAVLDAAYDEGRSTHVDPHGTVVIDDAVDVTDGGPPAPTATATTQLDELENRVTAPKPAVQPKPQTVVEGGVTNAPLAQNGAPVAIPKMADLQKWSELAIAAMMIEPPAPKAWYEQWWKVNAKGLEACEFSAPEAYEQVVAVYDERTGQKSAA